ncbi:MAG: ribonuclease HII [alpha proteobacterium MED-G10]|nr:ribonuclease HII [Rickettsiales bacterium]PDH56357.1 MAG: ribonuclease HII [alpha proteobacterium MED-G10]
MLKNEKKFFEDVTNNIIGVDEVGRGALCGPVVSCSVLLKKEILQFDLVNQINDSKKISEKKRKTLSNFIKKNSTFYFGIASNLEIDEINILQATILSMKRSLKNFCNHKNKTKIDGQKTFHHNNNTFFIKKGDQKSISIASASILAKTFRDKLICNYGNEYPEYDLCSNKGYGTKKHFKAIKHFGITPIHRKSFLRNFL